MSKLATTWPMASGHGYGTMRDQEGLQLLKIANDHFQYCIYNGTAKEMKVCVYNPDCNQCQHKVYQIKLFPFYKVDYNN